MLRGPFILPGGKARRGESRFQAAVRELAEETHLVARCAVELFEYIGAPNARWRYQDHHKIIYIIAPGIPRPGHEVVSVRWHTDGDTLRVTTESLAIIAEFRRFQAQHQEYFERIRELTGEARL